MKETGVATLPAPQPYRVTYLGAAADDSRVFFTSASRLTPDSGAGAQSGGDLPTSTSMTSPPTRCAT